ncbi:MAG: serine/threonine protein kinase [Gammaproteobacteria bacterium]|nr:serine/threonine protein kinase [Gammaproteobacteria bacterium]
MNPDRWLLVQRVFTEAAEAPLAARAAIIAKGCGDDEELRREVEEMLAFDTGGEEVLRQAIGGAVTEAVHGEHSRLIGTVIGSYRIKGVLGYGGMGTVYDAERADDHFKQRVAIKLVQQMAVHPQLRSRLRAERQILANLDHPYIARLIDGGELPNGTPYLVIEYVDGKSIEQYCNDNHLGIHERLQLFEKVCAAVDYAHRNLVVHRDLKPANILVTADGTPKLLDFGIAKLLNPDPAWATVAAVTRVQDRLLTPEHASPEQVLGRTITTASDVYALGALLYHLLCDRSPYALKNSTPLALERAICNEDPPHPSSLFRSVREGAPPAEDGFDPHQAAQLRGVTVAKLRRQLAGDVDEIILKALRKEPEQRYPTAGQLADELRRHRNGEAVIARQGVRRYRIEKFVRRHALPISMVSVLIGSLITFAIFMWLKTQELALQRDAARQEKEWAEQTSAFLANIFDAADPYSTGGKEVTARELLEQAPAASATRRNCSLPKCRRDCWKASATRTTARATRTRRWICWRRRCTSARVPASRTWRWRRPW